MFCSLTNFLCSIVTPTVWSVAKVKVQFFTELHKSGKIQLNKQVSLSRGIPLKFLLHVV